MRKVTINYDTTAEVYGLLEDAKHEIGINCPIVARPYDTVSCHIGCAWFKIINWQGVPDECYCGDKLIGELVDAGK